MSPLRRFQAGAWIVAPLLALSGACVQAGQDGVEIDTEPDDVLIPTDASLRFSGQHALDHVRTQLDFGPRPAGSVANRQMRDWIVTEVEALGWQTMRQPFSPGSGISAENIIAVKGQGRTILLGAHHDTRLISDQDPDPALAPLPGPGANDGGSGVALLLELARVFATPPDGIQLCLVWFDAEDNGDIESFQWAIGSQFYVDHADSLGDCGRPAAVVVVDMIGDADQTIYRDFGSTGALQDALWAHAAALGHRGIIDSRRYTILDDHLAFRDVGIPALVMIDFEYDHWHKSSDTIDKISAASLKSVGQTVESWLISGATF